MGELKPCPCGAKAKLLETDGLSESYGVFNDVMYSKVICQQCSFSADDVEDWNNRASQSQWVSVDDGSPSSDGHCWVSFVFGDERIQCEGYYFTSNGNFDTDLVDFPDVTHWQPLPTPPEEIDCENNSRSKRA